MSQEQNLVRLVGKTNDKIDKFIWFETSYPNKIRNEKIKKNVDLYVDTRYLDYFLEHLVSLNELKKFNLRQFNQEYHGEANAIAFNSRLHKKSLEKIKSSSRCYELKQIGVDIGTQRSNGKMKDGEGSIEIKYIFIDPQIQDPDSYPQIVLNIHVHADLVKNLVWRYTATNGIPFFRDVNPANNFEYKVKLLPYFNSLFNEIERYLEELENYMHMNSQNKKNIDILEGITVFNYPQIFEIANNSITVFKRIELADNMEKHYLIKLQELEAKHDQDIKKIEGDFNQKYSNMQKTLEDLKQRLDDSCGIIQDHSKKQLAVTTFFSNSSTSTKKEGETNQLFIATTDAELEKLKKAVPSCNTM